ncbi:MAG: hypothetical protein LASZOEIN_001262, partial [Candidatus Fervidibacter sp.]
RDGEGGRASGCHQACHPFPFCLPLAEGIGGSKQRGEGLNWLVILGDDHKEWMSGSGQKVGDKGSVGTCLDGS